MGITVTTLATERCSPWLNSAEEQAAGEPPYPSPWTLYGVNTNWTKSRRRASQGPDVPPLRGQPASYAGGRWDTMAKIRDSDIGMVDQLGGAGGPSERTTDESAKEFDPSARICRDGGASAEPESSYPV